MTSCRHTMKNPSLVLLCFRHHEHFHCIVLFGEKDKRKDTSVTNSFTCNPGARLIILSTSTALWCCSCTKGFGNFSKTYFVGMYIDLFFIFTTAIHNYIIIVFIIKKSSWWKSSINSKTTWRSQFEHFRTLHQLKLSVPFSKTGPGGGNDTKNLVWISHVFPYP